MLCRGVGLEVDCRGDEVNEEEGAEKRYWRLCRSNSWVVEFCKGSRARSFRSDWVNIEGRIVGRNGGRKEKNRKGNER